MLQAVEKIMLIMFNEGNVQYEIQGTNYQGFAALPRAGGLAQSLAGAGGVGGLSFLPANHPGLHPAALQLPLGYDFAAAYGLQQTQVSWT